MNSSECLQIVLIVICSFGLLFFLANYNNMMPVNESPGVHNVSVRNAPPQNFMEHLTNDDKPVATPAPVLVKDDSNGLSVSASEQLGRNEVYQSVDGGKQGPFGLGGNKTPSDCYPKDQLSPEDLLPGDANSMWAKNAPVSGDLKDQNFLTAGYHTGVNTVGQSLRNANRQLRSEPPNPQVKVSPWMQTTIDPDMNRRPLEIGGCD
jgi:hypothetical protein